MPILDSNNKTGTLLVFDCCNWMDTVPILDNINKRGTLLVFDCYNWMDAMPILDSINKRGTLKVLVHHGFCWCPGYGSAPVPGNRSHQFNTLSWPTPNAIGTMFSAVLAIHTTCQSVNTHTRVCTTPTYPHPTPPPNVA